MESQLRAKIEAILKELPAQLDACNLMTPTDRRNELQRINSVLKDLENSITRFQLLTGSRQPELYEKYEEEYGRLTEVFKKQNEVEVKVPPIAAEQNLDAQKQQGQALLDEGMTRALSMLKTVNDMREEVNLIDDEVMLQREKMMVINSRLKETQNLVNQTKRVLAFLSKAVYDDVYIKIMIAVIAVVILIVLAMAIRIKIKRSGFEQLNRERKQAIQSRQDYSEIDETIFQNLIKKSRRKLAKKASATAEPLKKLSDKKKSRNV